MITVATTNGHASRKAAITGDRNRKPPAMLVDTAPIPAELKRLDRWLGWRWTWKPKEDGGGKYDKPPINAITGGAGSSTNQETWCSFAEAIAAVDRHKLDGIGMAFDPSLGLVGIDLDSCRDPITGDVDEWAWAIVRLFDSYTEISPSGAGLRIVCRGTLPKLYAKVVGKIEWYNSGRYLTFTGHILPNGPTTIADASLVIPQFNEAYMTVAENRSDLSGPELAVAALDAIKPSMADDYWDWLRVGMALKAVDESLLTEWDRWSASSEKYSAGECEKKWQSFRRGGVGLGSLIFWAKSNGWTPPRVRSAMRKLTDLGNAERFAAEHGNDVRYCHVWGKWYVWDGRRWKFDTSGEIVRRAGRTVRKIYTEVEHAETPEQREAIARFAAASEKRDRINAMIGLGQSQEPIPIAVESLDVAPWLLNCQNGTIDLKTGELLPHRRDDFLTKLCPVEYPVDAGTDPPLWLEFLDAIFAGNAKLIRYLQCLVGSWLPGVVVEHLLPILYGAGANGKSVFIETICGMLGSDYAMRAPPGFLIASKSERHPTELADLHGKRLVAAVETADGGRLSEVLAKELSGGDKIRARRMREDFWEFSPSHSLVLASNYKPAIRGTDHGIWRRVRLIPFLVTIPEADQDKHLAAKLRGEWPMILRWALRGCLDWQRNGFDTPSDVLAATETYKVESDTFKQWFEECCLADPAGEWKASSAYKNYRSWCEDANEHPISNMKFSERVSLHGFTKSTRRRDGYYYLGFKHLHPLCEHHEHCEQ